MLDRVSSEICRHAHTHPILVSEPQLSDIYFYMDPPPKLTFVKAFGMYGAYERSMVKRDEFPRNIASHQKVRTQHFSPVQAPDRCLHCSQPAGLAS